METILLLHTAPLEVLEEIEAVLDTPQTRVVLAITDARRSSVPPKWTEVVGFSGMISWKNRELLSIIRSIKPDRVVLSHGHRWFHDNVQEALDLWQLLHDFDISILRPGEEEQLQLRVNRFPGWVSGMLAAGFAALLVLAGVLGGWLGMVWAASLVLVSELLLRGLHSALKADGSIHNQTSQFIQSSGQACTTPHPDFGWINRPDSVGAMSTTMKGVGEHRWAYRHDQEGRRLTSELPATEDERPRIAVLGCSATHGQGVNDEETYAWLLQQAFPEHRVQNYGVGAYSLYQMLLRLERMLETDAPAAVVIGIHDLLIGRDVNGFMDRVIYFRHFRSPSCLSRKGRLKRFAPAGFEVLPLSRWVRVIKSLEYALNRFRFRGRDSDELAAQSAFHVLLAIQHRCQQAKIPLLITCIDNSERFYDVLSKKGFSWCVTGVDNLARLAKGDVSWSLAPYDTHPNQQAHEQMAKVTTEALRQVLAGRVVRPDVELFAGHVVTKNKGEALYIYPHF